MEAPKQYLNVEAEAPNQLEGPITGPGQPVRRRWALTCAVTALVLMAVVFENFGGAAALRASVNKASTALGNAFVGGHAFNFPATRQGTGQGPQSALKHLHGAEHAHSAIRMTQNDEAAITKGDSSSINNAFGQFFDDGSISPSGLDRSAFRSSNNDAFGQFFEGEAENTRGERNSWRIWRRQHNPIDSSSINDAFGEFSDGGSISLSGLDRSAAILLDEYFHVALQLDLDKNDLTEFLNVRGFDQKQILEAGFKTWPGGTMRLPFMESATDIGVKDMDIPPSMLIPARTQDGLITAIQIKPHFPPKGYKYRWANRDKSFKLYRNNVNAPQAWPEIEEPLFVCEAGGGAHKSVALIEGGLKAYVLASQLKARHAELHGWVIGASGGQFWQTPSGLCNALAGMQTDKVVLYPDAGVTQNKDVLLSYFRSLDMLREWGIDVAVAWWGQNTEENDLDVDDFLIQGGDLSHVQELSVQDFWSKVPEVIRVQLPMENFPGDDGNIIRRVLAYHG